MTYPPQEFSAIEICISAFYTYCAFFIVTTAAEIVAADSFAQSAVTSVAAAVALAFLGRIWIKQQLTRGRFANLALLLVAGLVALDTAAAVV